MSGATHKCDETIVTMTLGDLRRTVREEATAAFTAALEPQRQRWADVEGAARHVGVSTKTIIRWIERGMPATRLGRDYRLRIADLDHWLEQHRVAPKRGT